MIPFSPRERRSEIQNSLTPFRITHPVYPYDLVIHRDTANVLRSDKDVLFPIRSRFDLEWREIRCEFVDLRGLLTIIFILIRLLTASMNTSNSSAQYKVSRLHNSSRAVHVPKQRIGHPIASQSESSKQMVENDFSPPLNERGSLSLPWVAACSSVWTWKNTKIKLPSFFKE